MKRWMLAVMIAFGCHGSSKEGPPTGAYEATDTNSAEAKQQTEKALSLLRTAKKDDSIQLTSVRTFEHQVVNGMNYKLGLAITSASGPHDIQLTMYVPSSGDPVLTQIDGI